MSYATHMNESCYKYALDMGSVAVWQVLPSHVSHMNESCHTYECFVPHNELYHTYA